VVEVSPALHRGPAARRTELSVLEGRLEEEFGSDPDRIKCPDRRDPQEERGSPGCPSSPAADWRFAPIGSTPLYKKQHGAFLQKFNILRKKGEINFKTGGIGSALVSILQSLKVHNSINEKEG
jgi:hypothetical protein